MRGDEVALRQDIVEQYRYLDSIGLMEQAAGNVSCRIDDGMLISPAGVTAGLISAGTIVRMTLEGEWEGETRPSSEWRMHAAIYRQTGAGAVIHTHADHCVALSCLGRSLPGFHYLVGTFGGTDVPCVPYSTFGSEQLAQDAANALHDRSACLLGSHGMIAAAQDLSTAGAVTHRLEILCRQYLLACQLGEPYLLSQAEWDDFFERFRGVQYGTFV